MKLSETLKELRIKSGRTQEEIASILGVGKEVYRKWEIEKKPNYLALVRLAALYRMTVDDLLKGPTPEQGVAAQNSLQKLKNGVKYHCDCIKKLLGEFELEGNNE